jgi:hypothetical protein
MIAQQSRYVLAIENPSWLGSGENADDRLVVLVGPYLNRALAGRHADRPLQRAKALEGPGRNMPTLATGTRLSQRLPARQRFTLGSAPPWMPPA